VSDLSVCAFCVAVVIAIGGRMNGGTATPHKRMMTLLSLPFKFLLIWSTNLCVLCVDCSSPFSLFGTTTAQQVLGLVASRFVFALHCTVTREIHH
jgi:hypothetical protein